MSEEARSDIRALDRTTPMLVFDGFRFAQTGHGDVRVLQGVLRLRIGDYRVFFSPTAEGLHVHSVRNRKDAYR